MLTTAAPNAHAEGGVPLWTNRYSGPAHRYDGASAVALDGSGNVFVTGASQGVGFSEYMTIAYSGAGLALWTNRYKETGDIGDYAYAVAVDASGNVFVTGVALDNSGVKFDFATIAYSGAGIPLWTNRYNGPGNDRDAAYALAVDGSGNVFVTGESVGSGSSKDYATVAYSGAGVPLWTNRYNGPGNGFDIARAVAVDSSGNVFVTGDSDGGGGYTDYATIAYSGAGVPLWTNRYNGPGNGGDYANAVAVDGSGNVFVTGYSDGSGGNSDYATIAYSGSGVPLWTNRYNGPGDDFAIARAVAVDGNGNVFVTGDSHGGDFSSDYATVAYSGAGVPLWTNRYDGPGNFGDYANAVAVDNSGNVFVTGESDGSGGYTDYATIAYSGAGVPLWTNRYSGPGNGGNYAKAVAVDGSGNVFVTGESWGDDDSSDFATIKYATAIPPGYNRITGQLLPGGEMSLSFVGIAGTDYALDRTFNLTPPINWMPQETNPAGAGGVLVFTNTPNPDTNNFWRIRSVP